MYSVLLIIVDIITNIHSPFNARHLQTHLYLSLALPKHPLFIFAVTWRMFFF